MGQGAERQLRASLASLWSPFVPRTLGGTMATERPEDLALVRAFVRGREGHAGGGRTYPREGHAAGKVAVTI